MEEVLVKPEWSALKKVTFDLPACNGSLVARDIRAPPMSPDLSLLVVYPPLVSLTSMDIVLVKIHLRADFDS